MSDDFIQIPVKALPVVVEFDGPRLPRGNTKPQSQMSRTEKVLFHYSEACRSLALANYWLELKDE